MYCLAASVSAVAFCLSAASFALASASAFAALVSPDPPAEPLASAAV